MIAIGGGLLSRLEVLRGNLVKREHLTAKHVSNDSQSTFLCPRRFLLSVDDRAVFHDDNSIAVLMSVAGSPEHGIVRRCAGNENRIAAHSPQRVIEIVMGETAQETLVNKDILVNKRFLSGFSHNDLDYTL